MNFQKIKIYLNIIFILFLLILEAYATDLKYIKREYLTTCNNITVKTWQEYESNLNYINKIIVDTVKELDKKNRVIKTMIDDLDKTLEKVEEKLRGQDLTKRSTSTLNFMDNVKEELNETKKKIEEGRILINDSQKNAGSVYCTVNKYIDLYVNKTNESKRKGWDDVAMQTANTAKKMETKKKLIYSTIKEFDKYFGHLSDLFSLCEHKIQLVFEIQNNIVAFIDSSCNDLSKPCIYKMPRDIKLDRLAIMDKIKNIQETFYQLTQTIDNKFSEDLIKK